MTTPKPPAPPVQHPVNPDAYRIDHCDRCGRPDAVRRHARRRHCESCRLYAASERASKRAKELADAADVAFLKRRLLVALIEDERTLKRDAERAQREAGECRVPAPTQRMVVPSLVGSDVADALPPARLLHHRKARTLIWHARDVVVRRYGEPMRQSSMRRVAWYGFGSGDWKMRGGRMSGAGGMPSREPKEYTRCDGGHERCA